ncbi:MAG TPA: tetratricopeptide repeat protein, partial [Gallionella sp.]|nr:tetratricopeptide repeat protein [Gallionella sp.]
MQINLRTLSLALVLAGVISAPSLAAQQENSTELLLRGAKKWVAKDRPDLAKNMLQKLILIDPASEEALFMLGNIELRNGKPDVALRHLRALEKIAPGSPRTRELGDSYRLATSDKNTLEKARSLAQAGKIAEAEKVIKQVFHDKPPKGDLALDYYRIIGSSKAGFSVAQDELAALFKETGDTRYRLLQLELQANNPQHLASAINGYEDLAKRQDVNPRQLQENWRRALYKSPDNSDKQNAIQRFLNTYPNDREMVELLGDVQKNIAGQRLIAKQLPIAAATGTSATGATEAKRPRDKKLREAKPQQAEASVPAAENPDIVARTAAMDALDDGNIEFAEKTLSDVLTRRPQDPEVMGGLGLVKLKQGKPGEAEQWFRKALQATKGESSKWQSLVVTAGFWKNIRAADDLLEKKRLPEAEAAAQQALALQPGDADALALLGNIKAAGNDLNSAERLYREALAKEGYNVSAIRGLINLLSRTGRSEEALQLVEQVHQKYPNELNSNPGTQAGLLREEAELYVAAHRPSHAIQALEMAVLVDPKNPWARFSLAKLYISMNLAPLGKRILQEGVALDPKNPDMHYVQGLVLLSLDEYAAGIDTLAQIPEADRTPAMRDTWNRALLQYYSQQAERQLALGNRKAAIRIMSVAETQAQGNYAATEQVAEGWFKLGLQKQGLNAMRKLPQPVPLETQVHFASLLNRAKKDAELVDYLPSLRIPDTADDAAKKYRATVQDIEFAMAGRQFDKLMKEGKKEQAQQFADTVLNANQLSSAEYFRMHRNYFSRAELPADAITQLNQEKEQSPEDLDIRWDLAYAYYQNKQNSNAQRELQELLALTKGDDIDMRLRIAKLQQNTGDVAGSRQTIDDLTSRYPDNTEVLLQAGFLARANGRYNEAMDYFEQTRAQSPKAAPTATAATATAQDATSHDILLNLLPAQKTPSASGPTAGADLANTLASTPESERIYRTALASDASQQKYVANNAAAQAEQEMAEISSHRSAKIEVGLDIQSKFSNSGTSTYNATEIPLLARFPIGYEAHGTVQIDKVDIDAGALPATFADASLFGKIKAYQFVPAQPLTPKASGTSIGLGYEEDSVKADIGVVGAGFPVSNVVGGIRTGGQIGRLSYSLNLSRRPQTGSQLAYAGAKDPVT